MWRSVHEWIEKGLYRPPYGILDQSRLRKIERLLFSSSFEDKNEDEELVRRLLATLKNNPEIAFDVLDALLFLGHDPEGLDEILWDLDHEYTVHSDGNKLVLRVDDTAWAAYATAVNEGDEAAKHLELAWEKQYSRKDNNPDGAWEESTKAVEALLKPIVSPSDARATLGKMIGALRDKPEKWETSIPGGIPAFVNALNIVKYNPGRHGGAGAVATLGQSVIVLHQAIAIVNWLRQDSLRMIEKAI